MNGNTTTPIIALPTPERSQEALAESRRLFQRALGGWVSDLLRQRRAGLTRATWIPTQDADELSRAA